MSATGRECTIDQIREKAMKKGLLALTPRANELLLDLDQSMNDVTLRILRDEKLIEDELTTTSAGGNRHLYLRLVRQLSHAERIALQASLGSDAQREMLSMVRFLTEGCVPTVLFETPQEALKVLQWRKAKDAPIADEDIPF